MISRKRNLILFLPDQQRADTISCYGAKPSIAPNLSKLATQSTIFDRAYVTQPVCTPSRASLMTGLWPHQSGCTKNGDALAPKFLTLPELFADKDYLTAYLGKWHIGMEGTPPRAFQKWVSTQGNSDYSRFLISKGLRPDRKEGGFSDLVVSDLPLELSQPRFLQQQACDFLERHQRDSFLLVVAFVEPHSPYNGPFNSEHNLDEMTLDPSSTAAPSDDVPLRYQLIHEWQQARASSDNEGLLRQFYFGVTQEDYRSLKQRYLGLVTLVDQAIGAILDCVERSGLSENTVIVHTSDHGDMMGAHQLFAKEVMYEQAVRVPFLVREPGQQTQRRVAQAVSHIDFAPTILDLMDQPQAEQCAGVSRAPLLRGEESQPDNVFIEWSPNWRDKIAERSSLAPRREIKRAVQESTRTVISPDGWKLSLRDKDLNELYDLNKDPDELHNLYHNDNYTDKVSSLRAEIERWQKATRDRLQLSAG